MNTMKTKFSIVLTVLLGSGWFVGASALEFGDSLNQVIEELGQPDGYVKLEGSQILYYARGRVELTNGKVTLAELVSAEEAEARRIREAEAQAQRQEELRLLREQRYAEGKVALEAKISDTAFQQASSTQRIAYWETFKRNYPEVPLPEDYYTALRERDLERREQRASARLDDLERRTQNAEERAYQAEDRAYEAERRSSYSTYDTVSSYPRYVVPYSTYSVYDHGSRRSTVHNRDRSQSDRSQYERNHYDRAHTTVHRRIGNMPQATYRPYESTAGYGFQRPTGSSVRSTHSRHGPYRASDGVNADVHIRF